MERPRGEDDRARGHGPFAAVRDAPHADRAASFADDLRRKRTFRCLAFHPHFSAKFQATPLHLRRPILSARDLDVWILFLFVRPSI